MDTASLKSFATSARVELIREVGARITAVLSQAAPERIEQPRAVTALEREISAAGGGDKGKAHVVDRVAYTWFNRIIALRFMDANRYTGIGIVSPAADQVGQPEILAVAKRGQIDGNVVMGTNLTIIKGLLDGTRPSRPGFDAHAEAYALLLADYCRHWNRAMPFMFEREGDYTELLIPANILAEDSVLSRSVHVLTEEVCHDVEVIGWLYQFYISERKDEVFAGFKVNKKAGADEIPAATQLFTPHWIVRYLVENSVGRLWMLNHPESRLVDQMDFYISPVDEETDFLKITKPEELTVIDPACGSGHMLTYAFDLLYSIYEEEGYAPSQIPELILTNNVYGTEIDPRAGALAAFALTMKAASKRKLFLKNPIEPKVCVLEPISFSAYELNYLVTANGDCHMEELFWNQFREANVFGSLVQPDSDLAAQLSAHLEQLEVAGEIFRADVLDRAQQVIRQAEFLSVRHCVLVANPPYMDARNMGAVLYDFVDEHFPEGSSGLDLAFVLRSRSQVLEKGYLGLLTMDSWLGNVECAQFRELIREALSPRMVLHLGSRAFPEIGGEVVRVSATLFQNTVPSSASCVFIGATAGATTDAKIEQFRNVSMRFVHQLDWFDVFPGRVFTPYAASETVHGTFETAPAMKSIADVRTGLQTGDNPRFLRQWFEVSRSRIRRGQFGDDSRWVPYVKSSSPTRWFAREEFVVDWRNDGADIRAHSSSVVRNETYYFRSGLSYGGLAGNLKVRLVSEGTIFDQKNSMVFPIGSASTYQLLALMNSPAFEMLGRLVSPKGFGVGTLAQLPIPREALSAAHIEAKAQRAVECSRLIFDRSETSRGFNGLKSIFLGAERIHLLRLAVETAQDAETRIQGELRGIETEIAAFFRSALLSLSQEEKVDRPDQAPYPAELIVQDLVSYAVGCIAGRYSLDEPGLILADQGATFEDYVAKVSKPTFTPDADNVIPIVQGDWFEDDIVARFRQFLREAFGEQNFEENLQFVTESLGVKHLRDYFVKSFYKDHVKRYKNRPIYWLFSSPKGSFTALVYMHRYTPSTVSAVLTYLREYVTKLEFALQQAERAGDAKEADRLRKIIVELNEYEHDTLFPKASENVVIDLDDGVKANYPKFGAALKKVKGLEVARG